MNKVIFAALGALSVLSACVAPPASPMEGAARKAMAAELVAKQCAGFAGGYQAAKDLRSDANRQMVIARNLGATDADLKKARMVVGNAFGTMEAFTSRQEACNSMIGELAWSNNV